MIVHTKEYLEGKYAIADPWGYKTNPCDRVRRRLVLEAIPHRRYKRALDIGAGEGWITRLLPADEIDGYEISDNAAARFPDNVRRIKKPQGKYDLVIATGVFYKHYDVQQMQKIVYRVASDVVVTCHLEEHEVRLEGHEVATRAFPYNDKLEILRVYDFSLS